MAGLAKVQLNDTIDIQRQKLNNSIDSLNSLNVAGGISIVDTEAQLPNPAISASNLFIVKKHTVFGGSCLASIVNSSYKYNIIKNDIINGSAFIYVTSDKLGDGVIQNKCVYLDSNGVWQLASYTDKAKFPFAIAGPFLSIIFEGVVKFTNMELEVGKRYYCDDSGTLTTTDTGIYVGQAISVNSMFIHIKEGLFQQQADWNQIDTSKVDYIKNKPTIVSKTAAGFVPKLPNEATVSKFFRQDGTWAEPSFPTSNFIKKTGDTMTGLLTDANASQLRNIQILTQEADTGVDGQLYAVIEDY